MTTKEWRAAHRDYLREYHRQYREKQKNVCEMNCFSCPYPDCQNSSPPTRAEAQMIRDAFGADDPVSLRRKELEQKQYHRMYSKYRYAKKKETA